jgi:hypothetical protein
MCVPRIVVSKEEGEYGVLQILRYATPRTRNDVIDDSLRLRSLQCTSIVFGVQYVLAN